MPEITAAQSAELFRAYKAGAVTQNGDTMRLVHTERPFRWKSPSGSREVGPAFSHEIADRLERYRPLLQPQKRIEAAWQRAGGAASPVGIPAERDISVVRDGDGWLSHFRGGTVRMKADGSLEVVERFVVTMVLRALHCVRRTENGNDEVYGSVAIIGNPPGLVKEIKIPTYEFNKTNVRIAEFSDSVEFLRGTSVALSALLMEHDSGDRDKIRGKIRKFYDDVETKVRTLTDPLIGEQLSEFAVGTLGNVLNVLTIGTFDLLGMGDDRFNPASKLIDWGEFYNMPPKGTYSHPPDPKHGPYRFKLDISYPGGGLYACYFDADVRREVPNTPFG